MKVISMGINIRRRKGFYYRCSEGITDYLFVLFKSPAVVCVNGEEVTVGEGTGIIFKKGSPAYYHSTEDSEFLHDFFRFDPETDTESVILSSIPFNELITIPAIDAITTIISELEREKRDKNSRYKGEIMSGLTLCLFFRIKGFLRSEVDVDQVYLYKTLYRIRDEIYNTPSKDWCVESIAEQVCLSRSYLQHIYKRFFGISCIEDVIQARISFAKTALTNTPDSISEIAEACGYKNTEHFSRQFKIRTGYTPREYRKKAQSI